MRPTSSVRRSRGITLIELMVVLSIIGILGATTGFAMRSWAQSARARTTVRGLADLIHLGRAEAIRRSVNHVVLFGADVQDNPMFATDGITPAWAALIRDDDMDGQIDGGELVEFVHTPPVGSSVVYGRNTRPMVPTNAGAMMGDPFAGTAQEGGAGELASAGKFRHPTDNTRVQHWVVIAPDGTPRAARLTGGTLVTAGIGTGDGAVYVTDGVREYALVMAPLGAIRTFVWDAQANQWR